MRIVLTVLFAVATAATIAWSTAMLTVFRSGERPGLAIAAAVSWVLFAAALLALRRVRGRRAVTWIVLGGTVLIGAAGLLGAPNTSTDSARYAWDGIVANAGISPYDHVPASDELDGIRQDWLFPTPVDDGSKNGFACPGLRISETESVPDGDPLCTALNRPTVPTIYPPVAEGYFAAVRWVVGPAAEYWPLQLTGLAISVAVTAVLLLGLRRHGLDPRWAAAWGWCPLVVTEAVTNSHVDALGAALAVGATLLVASGHRIWGGIAMGAAIATKLIPVIAAPPLIRRKPVGVIVAAVLTFAVVYVPYVVASGPEVLGYLPGYLSEEGYEDGSRFALLTLVLPGSVALPVAAVLLAIIAGLCFWKTDPARPWMTQVVLIGATLLVVSPRYAWYALLLVPFIALSGRWEWFAVPLALTARLLIPSLTVIRVGIALAVVAVVIGWLVRRRLAARQGADAAPAVEVGT